MRCYKSVESGNDEFACDPKELVMPPSSVDIDAIGRFSVIREWDIDLLLLEELHCNADFVCWLYGLVRSRVSRVALPQISNIQCLARHSVSYSGDGSGESDLEAVFSGVSKGARSHVLVLIEDKIDATFTPYQPERYLKRCSALNSAGQYSAAITLLIAPEDYLSSAGSQCFDAILAYEQVMEQLGQVRQFGERELHSRREHKLLMLQHALTRYRRGGNRINDDERSSFFDDYFSLALQRQPTLRQKPSRARSAASRGFFYELYPRLSEGFDELYMEHGLDRGFVTIYFRGWGQNRDWYVPRLRKIIDDRRMIVDSPPDKQFVQVRIAGLPQLRLETPIAEQVAAAHECIDAAAALLDWYQRNRPQFEIWVRELVDQTD
jgi:hypothetical protein